MLIHQWHPMFSIIRSLCVGLSMVVMVSAIINEARGAVDAAAPEEAATENAPATAATAYVLS